MDQHGELFQENVGDFHVIVQSRGDTLFLPAMLAHAVISVDVGGSNLLSSWINVEVRPANRTGQLSWVLPTGSREASNPVPRQKGKRKRKFTRQLKKK